MQSPLLDNHGGTETQSVQEFSINYLKQAKERTRDEELKGVLGGVSCWPQALCHKIGYFE